MKDKNEKHYIETDNKELIEGLTAHPRNYSYKKEKIEVAINVLKREFVTKVFVASNLLKEFSEVAENMCPYLKIKECSLIEDRIIVLNSHYRLYGKAVLLEDIISLYEAVRKIMDSESIRASVNDMDSDMFVFRGNDGKLIGHLIHDKFISELKS